MSKIASLLTLSRRLYLLTALFAVGLGMTGALALRAQWNAMRSERIGELASMTELATSVIDRVRLSAAAANLSEAEAKTQALQAINAMRYSGSGYFSVTDGQAVVLIHPVPAIIGTTATKTPDANGFNFVQDVLPRARRDGHADVSYVYPRPGQTEALPKIADYRHYKPWDWVVQTGVYVDDLDAAFWQSARAECAASLGILAVLLVGSWLAIRSIIRPLRAMRGVMERLAGGDMAPAALRIASNDELGKMAVTIGVFHENMIEVVRLRAEQEALKAGGEKTRKAMLDKLATDFETRMGAMATRLSSVSGDFEQTARVMSSNTRDAGDLAIAVSGASSKANAGVQTVAAAAEELASSIGEITRQVTESAKMTAETAQEAQRTNGIVQQLAQTAQRVGDVVGLINNIAGQTNLLALNATIEAARAGESGKGFAVVASEVKSLANQTAKATGEIGSQIAQIQEATRHAVDAIEGIVSRVDRANSISTSIAAAVEQQGAATAEIARSVQETAGSTQDVSSTIREIGDVIKATGTAASDVLAATGGLSRQASEISSEVSAFALSVRAA